MITLAVHLHTLVQTDTQILMLLKDHFHVVETLLDILVLVLYNALRSLLSNLFS